MINVREGTVNDAKSVASLVVDLTNEIFQLNKTEH